MQTSDIFMTTFQTCWSLWYCHINQTVVHDTGYGTDTNDTNMFTYYEWKLYTVRQAHTIMLQSGHLTAKQHFMC